MFRGGTKLGGEGRITDCVTPCFCDGLPGQKEGGLELVCVDLVVVFFIFLADNNPTKITFYVWNFTDG
jgi:hypothetical protein